MVDDKVEMIETKGLIGKETDSAERVRKHRSRLEEQKALHCNTLVTQRKDIDKEKDIRIKNRANKFAKPTLEEIKSYCVERKNKVNPENFMNHYDSNGWKVGKNPMKDWRAAVRTWERNQFSNKEIPELPEYYNRIEEEIDKTELLKKLKEM